MYTLTKRFGWIYVEKKENQSERSMVSIDCTQEQCELRWKGEGRGEGGSQAKKGSGTLARQNCNGTLFLS